MEKIVTNDEAEVVPFTELHSKERWYVPHFGVRHASKPDKLRVVLNCSAIYKDQYLNQNLLQGPNLTNNLLGVLCQFRKGFWMLKGCTTDLKFLLKIETTWDFFKMMKMEYGATEWMFIYLVLLPLPVALALVCWSWPEIMK